MLVQRGAITKRTKILLVVLGGLIIIGGGYFLYQTYLSNPQPEPETQVTTEQEVALPPGFSEFDDEIFNDPQLFSLQRQKFIGFADQYKGIALSGDNPIALKNINVINPTSGRKLVISWQLPDYINFNLIRVYRSDTAGQAGEVIYEEVIKEKEEDQPKIMNYQDRELVNNASYYYLVKSVYRNDSEGVEQESESRIDISRLQKVGVPTDEQPPASPDSVQVMGLADGTMKVTWLNPDDSDFERIKIYRSSESGRLGSLIDGAEYNNIGHKESKSDFRYYIDSDIQPNIVYYYTVTSVDASGNESSTDLLAAPSKAYFYNPFQPVEF